MQSKKGGRNALLALLLVLGTGAVAQTLFVSDSLTLDSPEFQRPDPGTPPVTTQPTLEFYSAQPFFVKTGGSYSLQTLSFAGPGSSDAMMFLYQGSFAPGTPLSNALTGDDNSAGGGLPLIVVTNLSTKTQYYLVTTTALLGVTGTFTNSLVGAGVIRLGYVAAATLRTDNAAVESAQRGLDAALAERNLVINLVRTGTRDVNARLFRLRAGGTGASLTEGAPAPESDTAKRISSLTTRRRLIVGGDAMAGVAARRGPSFELYATGDAGTWHRDDGDDGGAIRSHQYAGGLGAEVRLGSGLVLGLAGSYLDGDAWLDRADTEYTLTGWTVSPYVSYRSGRWFADALYAFSKVDLDLRRHTGAGGTARGSTGSDVHTFSANTGWDLVNSGGVHTGPIAGLDYLSGDLGGYHETGSARGAVKVEGQNFDSLISRLGWQLSYRVPTPVGVLTPQVRAEWAHEYLARAERVEAWLRQSPYSSVSELGSERVGHYKTSARTGATDRDTARVGAGMLMEFGRAAALLLDYEADLADADGVAQRGSLTLSLRF